MDEPWFKRDVRRRTTSTNNEEDTMHAAHPSHPHERRGAAAKTLRAAALAGIALFAGAAHAQDTYPSKPIRIIVPAAAGGNLDAVSRYMAERLTPPLKQSVIVENRIGASSTIGSRYVAQSAPDGYTLLGFGNTFTSVPALMTAGYDPVKEFSGVSMLVRLPEVVVVNANTPYKTIGELVAAAKAAPGTIAYGTAGAGSVAHFATERFAFQVGIKLVHVPYKGNSQAMVDLVGNRFPMMFDQISTSRQHIAEGRLRPLAITSAARSPLLPNVPTMSEAGVKDFEDYTWNAFAAPAGTPREIINRLHAEIVKVLNTPEVRARFNGQGLEVTPSASPDELNAFLKEDVTRAARIAKDANIKLE